MSIWNVSRKRFIFESGILNWADPNILSSRIEQWKRAGISDVMLQVDDGRGPTWPTSVPADSRIVLSNNPLIRAVTMIRRSGLSVIPVFNFIKPIYVHLRPEFYNSVKLPGGEYYDMWNDDFVNWRIDYILDCLSYIPCDAIGLDFIRTHRAAISPELDQMQRMIDVMTAIRQRIPSYHSIMTVTQSDYYTIPNSQGIDVQGWFDRKLTDKICIFCYRPTVPPYQFININRENLWLLVSSYNDVNGVPVSKSMADLENIYKQVLDLTPEAYGLYTANMLTEDHVLSLRTVDNRIKPDRSFPKRKSALIPSVSTQVAMDDFNLPIQFHTVLTNGTQVKFERALFSPTSALKLSLNRLTSTTPYRTEIIANRLPPPFVNGISAQMGNEYWYSFDIFLPDTFADDRSTEILGQWHATEDPGDSGISPPIAFYTAKSLGSNVFDQLSLSIKHSSNPLTNWSTYLGSTEFLVGSLASLRGKWTEWILRVKWSYLEDGRASLWRDKVLVVDHLGPNCYNDQLGPKFQIGIYKWTWDPNNAAYVGGSPDIEQHETERTLYIKNVRFGHIT